MSLDQAVKVRSEDALDAKVISDYIHQNLPDYTLTNDIEILQFPSGASNLTYELKLDNQSLILRTAPAGANIKSAHDMGREYKVLSRLIEHLAFDCIRFPIAFNWTLMLCERSTFGCFQFDSALD